MAWVCFWLEISRYWIIGRLRCMIRWFRCMVSWCRRMISWCRWMVRWLRFMVAWFGWVVRKCSFSIVWFLEMFLWFFKSYLKSIIKLSLNKFCIITLSRNDWFWLQALHGYQHCSSEELVSHHEITKKVIIRVFIFLLNQARQNHFRLNELPKLNCSWINQRKLKRASKSLII